MHGATYHDASNIQSKKALTQHFCFYQSRESERASDAPIRGSMLEAAEKFSSEVNCVEKGFFRSNAAVPVTVLVSVIKEIGFLGGGRRHSKNVECCNNEGSQH